MKKQSCSRNIHLLRGYLESNFISYIRVIAGIKSPKANLIKSSSYGLLRGGSENFSEGAISHIRNVFNRPGDSSACLSGVEPGISSDSILGRLKKGIPAYRPQSYPDAIFEDALDLRGGAPVRSCADLVEEADWIHNYGVTSR